MNMKKITTDFYARFCCVNNLENYYGKVTFISSEKRNEKLKGYGCKFLLYCLIDTNIAIIAYSPILESEINKIKNIATLENIEELIISNFHNITKRVLMIFDKEKSNDYGSAKILDAADYMAYEIFFRKANPKSDPTGWLKDYFYEKSKLHYFVGYYKNDELVSICDAPDMPYMQGIIQHTGILTLSKERRQGFAKQVCSLAVHNLIKLNICPQWDTNSDNIASIKLAESIGYKFFAKAYTIED